MLPLLAAATATATAGVGILLGNPLPKRSLGQKEILQSPFADAPKKYPSETEVIIIGGAAAGLSVASCLAKQGISSIVLEKFEHCGDMWRSRYHRLHLHDIVDDCHLPNFKMPDSFPTFISREQFASYLDAYAKVLQLDVRLKHNVTHIDNVGPKDWKVTVEDSNGDVPVIREFRALHVVIANGIYNDPKIPSIPGLDSFSGKVVHSSNYTNGTALNAQGKKVLVVGFGNSGAEILVDLVEHGAQPTILQRSPTCIVPRWVIQYAQTGLFRFDFLKYLPFFYLIFPVGVLVADVTMKILGRIHVGWIERYGVKICWDTPLLRILFKFDPPFVDVGTVSCIKSGKAKVKQGSIQRIDENGLVEFEDGSKDSFETIVFATGYEMLSGHKSLFSESLISRLGFGQKGIRSGNMFPGKESSVPGLWFVWGRLQMIREFAPMCARNIAVRLGRPVAFWTTWRRWIAYQVITSVVFIALGYYYATLLN